MKELKIVFTKSKKKMPLFSWAIMVWTGKPYSHVAREVEVRDWGKAYYQSSDNKVNYEYHTVFEKKHEIVKCYTLTISDEVDGEIRKACYQEAGKQYATKQVFGMLLVDTLGFFGIKIKNPWKEGRTCSESLYARAFKLIFPDLDYNEDTIKPEHIEEIILDRCQDMIIEVIDNTKQGEM